jgi:hypothetical protein
MLWFWVWGGGGEGRWTSVWVECCQCKVAGVTRPTSAQPQAALSSL